MKPGSVTDLRASVAELEAVARVARREIVKSVAHAKGGHIGGPLSAVDMLVALYFAVLRIRPDDPQWEERDRFILSKGHSAIALYTTLALRGYFPVSELSTFDAIDSRLPGHPDMRALAGLDMSTGSLGLGFSAGVGVALGAKLRGESFTTFVMLGDGECNEGIVWEGAHVARRYRLDNLVAIVDCNGLQQFGWPGATPSGRRAPYDGDELAAQWTAFGWRCSQVDGHDIGAVIDTLSSVRDAAGAPKVVLARTAKGRGVSFMTDQPGWHSRVPTPDELQRALAELTEPAGQA
jgi:transketolase